MAKVKMVDETKRTEYSKISIEMLPDDPLLHIFSYLDFRDLLQ